MDRAQIKLVQQCFARASRLGPHVAATFYAELFAIDPSLKALFKGDIIAQGRKIMDMLAQLVDGLSEPETIAPIVRELALRHVAYGVEARHYPIVGTALLRTLRHELGADFTPEARAAWSAVYDRLSAAMCEAAYGPAASRTR